MGGDLFSFFSFGMHVNSWQIIAGIFQAQSRSLIPIKAAATTKQTEMEFRVTVLYSVFVLFFFFLLCFFQYDAELFVVPLAKLLSNYVENCNVLFFCERRSIRFVSLRCPEVCFLFAQIGNRKLVICSYYLMLYNFMTI